jgi:hypothetical protein
MGSPQVEILIRSEFPKGSSALISQAALDSSFDRVPFPAIHSANVMFAVSKSSFRSSQLSSQQFNSESISTYVDGLSGSSDQQIWTVMDLYGPSGNTPKVPGSRPGRPTERSVVASRRFSLGSILSRVPISRCATTMRSERCKYGLRAIEMPVRHGGARRRQSGDRGVLAGAGASECRTG